jgi:hypothetical protein
MANYVPENERSARVLEKLGFEKEGYAKSYPRIAGKWLDHILTAKLNPKRPLEEPLTVDTVEKLRAIFWSRVLDQLSRKRRHSGFGLLATGPKVTSFD